MEYANERVLAQQRSVGRQDVVQPRLVVFELDKYTSEEKSPARFQPWFLYERATFRRSYHLGISN